MTIERIRQLAAKYFPRVVEIRRHLHAHPELSWQEHGTAAFVAAELNKLGFEVSTGIAKNGVVALLKGKEPQSRCLALRADMDALPIEEANDVPYKSCNKGVMHACGHDVHTANLLGAAMILADLKVEIKGTIKFIFQPSEEKVPSGAEAMIKDGVLTNPPVDRIMGLHVSPELEAGTFGFCPGRFMASSDELYITVKGKGGHAAQKEKLINPLLVASHLLLALERLNEGDNSFVLSFGKIEGRGATNVVPDVVEIAGTLRCFDENFRTRMLQQIGDTTTTIGAQYKASCELNVLSGYPVLLNDEPFTQQAKELAEQYAGDKYILELPKRMGSEDFAYYTHQVPGCFYRLGVGNTAKGITSGLHTPTFDVDESALEQSIGLMAWLAMNC
ncbi:MAG: M20 family metallopeptidase [Chitinophagales bacterium]